MQYGFCGFLASISMTDGSPSPHFQSTGVFRSEVSVLQATYRWVFFFFLIYSDTLCLLIGAFRPCTFRMIIDRYEFSAIVLPVKLGFLVMFSVPFQSVLLWSFFPKESTLILLQEWFSCHKLLQFVFGKLFIFPFILNDNLVASSPWLLIFPVQHVEYTMLLPSGLPGFCGQVCC